MIKLDDYDRGTWEMPMPSPSKQPRLSIKLYASNVRILPYLYLCFMGCVCSMLQGRRWGD
jgi:hypothetical protein